MKSVLVCAAQAPFVDGGAEIGVRELVSNLKRRGFRVDVVSLPFHGHPPLEVPRQALAWRLLELRHVTGDSVDLVIPTKFPSYLVRHHRKVAWVFHQYREAYELLGTELSPLGESSEDRGLVDTIRAMDKAALAERSSRTRRTSRAGSRATVESRRRRSTLRRSSSAATAATRTVASCSLPGASTVPSAPSWHCARSRARAPLCG